MQDFSDWWNTKRAADEIECWERERHWAGYASRVSTVMAKYKLQTVIEVGCGAGYVGNELKKAGYRDYTGLDASSIMIDTCREKFPDCNYTLADIRTFDIVAPADLVCTFSVLKHFSLEDWPIILERVLRLGRYGLVQLQIAPDPLETGIEFHHTFVRHNDVLKVFERSNKALLCIEENKTMTTGTEFFERTFLVGPADSAIY